MRSPDSAAGPDLAPVAIIGLGSWGGTVVSRTEAALRERCPAFAHACPMLTVADRNEEHDDEVASHIRRSRMAEAMRSLQQQGLLHLDPLIAPPTYLYVVVAGAEDPELTWVKQTMAVAEQAASAIGAPLRTMLLLSGDCKDVPVLPSRPAIYVMEPITRHGLVLDSDEFEAAVAEVLVGAVQPGVSAILADGRGRVHSVGVAWLAWNSLDLEEYLAHQVAREAVLRIVNDRTGAADIALEATEIGRLMRPEERAARLLHGLPITVHPSLDSGSWMVFLSDSRLTDPGHRQSHIRYFQRSAVTLERRVARWVQRMESGVEREKEVQAEAMDRSVGALRHGGPDGLARARRLAERVAEEAAHRRDEAGESAIPVVVPHLRALETAESSPAVQRVFVGLGAVGLVTVLVWSLLGGGWPGLLVSLVILGLGGMGYGWWRSHVVRSATERVAEALQARASALVEVALLRHLADLDDSLAAHATQIGKDMTAAGDRLREACASVRRTPVPVSRGGALCAPLLDEGGLHALAARSSRMVGEVGDAIVAAGGPVDWGDPDAIMSLATGVAREHLAYAYRREVAELLSQAYGGRLPDRLQSMVDGLVEWSQPMLSRPVDLTTSHRWLLWPAGLPCPPVPADVQVLPATRGCALLLTIAARDARSTVVSVGQRKRTAAL